MELWRLHIRPKGGWADKSLSFNYCIANEVVGMGWGVPDKYGLTLDWDEYFRIASEIHKNLSNVKTFHDSVKIDDLIWTRDQDGIYWLARVRGDWQYYAEAPAFDADIVNIRDCDFAKIENFDDVPGKVIACFRPKRTIQKIKDKNMSYYSMLLWNKLAETPNYSLKGIKVKQNVFTYLNDEACEDVIFIYLQSLGYIVIPHSRKADTMSYEFIVFDPHTNQRAIVQVKTGQTVLNKDDYRIFNQKVFLFQANGLYIGKENQNIICFNPVVIETFMRHNRNYMPNYINQWLDFTEELKK